MKKWDYIKQIGSFLTIFLLAYYLTFHAVPMINFKIRNRDYLECQKNVKAIRKALEQYAADNDYLYPESITQLIPDYLEKIPSCPSAGMETYSQSYRSTFDHKFVIFFCKGNYHNDFSNDDHYYWHQTPENEREKALDNLLYCHINLENIDRALDMYASDNKGQFPPSLDKLEPDYMKEIPACPSAGYDTYSDSYWTSYGHNYYEISCQGLNHKSASVFKDNFPKYYGPHGLMPRP